MLSGSGARWWWWHEFMVVAEAAGEGGLRLELDDGV